MVVLLYHKHRSVKLIKYLGVIICQFFLFHIYNQWKGEVKEGLQGECKKCPYFLFMNISTLK